MKLEQRLKDFVRKHFAEGAEDNETLFLELVRDGFAAFGDDEDTYVLSKKGPGGPGGRRNVDGTRVLDHRWLPAGLG
jgi:hypothetical protein